MSHRSYFADVAPVRFDGPDTTSPLAFRHYDADRVVLGRTMRDHLRFAVCYWHTFCWGGADTFGRDTFVQAWEADADPLRRAEQRTDAAFEFFAKLGVPFFTFHDRDVAPEGQTLAEGVRLLDHMVERIAARMEATGVRLLWGTANLFGHPRYGAGAATNPDPEVVACAAVQVKAALDATKRLGGENYVLWGGREGYSTLLNTDLGRELDQLGRFLALVCNYKHKIGFKGQLLIEPKPMEPTKHQYDFDVAAVYALLQKYDLEDEYRVNIEVNHATLAGHTFHHEVAYALANGVFGSVDANRGDALLGWDTDEFPTATPELGLVLAEIIRAGGMRQGGFNFDAKLRRESVDPVDLFYGHVAGMDAVARGLLHAEALLSSELASFVAQRYAGWDEGLGRSLRAGEIDLEGLARQGLERRLDPKPRSGRQERLEHLVSRTFEDVGRASNFTRGSTTRGAE